jgi:hypothetical protein
MKKKQNITIVIILFLIHLNLFSQVKNELILERKSNKLLILKTKDSNLDTISILKFNKKNQFIKCINDKIYSIEFKIPPIDNFSKSYFLVKKWSISEQEFILEKKFILTVGDCNIKKLKFSFNSKGLIWKYKSSAFKISNGEILLDSSNILDSYVIPCK